MFGQSLIRKSAVAASLIGAVAALSMPAQAGTATASLNISANVQTACAFGTVASPVSSYAMNFGTFIVGGSNLDAQLTVPVDCSSATAFTLATASGAKTMVDAGGSNSLVFELYTDAARTTVFGGANTIAPVAASGVTNNIIYGRIPQIGNASAVVGAYTDTIVVTMTF